MNKAQSNEAFVRLYQTKRGLDVDGWAGAKTRLDLDEAFPDPAPLPSPPRKPLDARSEERLMGVNERLAGVVRRASYLSPVPFIVVEGLRTQARQAELYAQGRTKPGPVVTWTMKSKHIEGKAVDLAPYENGKIDWNDLTKFDAIARAMRQAAAESGVSIRWGADWDGDGKPREKGETDSPHFEVS